MVSKRLFSLSLSRVLQFDMVLNVLNAGVKVSGAQVVWYGHRCSAESCAFHFAYAGFCVPVVSTAAAFTASVGPSLFRLIAESSND